MAFSRSETAFRIAAGADAPPSSALTRCWRPSAYIAAERSNAAAASTPARGGVELPFATAKIGVIARSPDSPWSRAGCARRPSRTNIRLSCIRNIRASPEIRHTRRVDMSPLCTWLWRRVHSLTPLPIAYGGSPRRCDLARSLSPAKCEPSVPPRRIQ
jgi:hypothetical protein